jgi:hypothetical protein
MSVAPISGFSDLPPGEALGRFKPRRLGTATGWGLRFGAQVSRPSATIQSHYLAFGRGEWLNRPFARPFEPPMSAFGRGWRSNIGAADGRAGRSLSRYLGDLRLEPVKVAFPLDIVGRQGGAANHDRVAPPQRVQRLDVIPHLSERIRNF